MSTSDGRIDRRFDRWVCAGAVLVGLAGCALVVAAFLPWKELSGRVADGGRGFRTYSGWELATSCAEPRFPSRCFLDDERSDVFVAYSVVTGGWAVVAGAVLVALAVAMAAKRRSCTLLAVGWVLVLGALAGGFVTLFDALDDPNVEPQIEVGVVVAALAPVVAVVGMVVVSAAYVMRAAALDDASVRE